jgi:hypothetical protein
MKVTKQSFLPFCGDDESRKGGGVFAVETSRFVSLKAGRMLWLVLLFVIISQYFY